MIASYTSKYKKQEKNREIGSENRRLAYIVQTHREGYPLYQAIHQQEALDARLRLYELNKKLIFDTINRICGRSGVFGDYKDELIGIGSLQLWVCTGEIDISRGSDFGTYASFYLECAMKNYLRKSGRFHSRSREPERRARFSNFQTPLEVLTKQEELDDVLQAMNNGILSERERYVLRSIYFNGVGVRALAEEQQVSDSMISFIHRRAIRKIQKALRSRHPDIPVFPEPVRKNK